MKKRAQSRRETFQWKPRSLSTVFVAALFATPGVTFANNLFFDPAYKWAPNLEIMGQAGSNDTVRGKLVLPLYQDPDSMLFTDLRARDTSDQGSEYNAGLAYRKILRDRCLIWGVYGFYDSLNSELNNHFNQITVGTEMLSQKWDARVNAYIPLTKKVYDDHLDIYTPIGHNIFAERGFEEAMWGVDGEVGYHMGIGLPTLYVGGYYFANTDVPTIAGPKVHADLKLGDFWRRMRHNDQDNMLDHVDMSLIGQYDSVRGWEGWVEGRLNFDLMGTHRPRMRGLDEMMKERIIRDNAINTGTFHGPNELLLNKDGNPYYIVYADSVHGDDSNPGTIEKPVQSAQQAVSAATGVAGGIYEQPGHSGDYIYLFPNGGYANPYGITSELNLAMNQTIHGGGADFIFHDFPRGDDFTLIKATTSSVIQPLSSSYSDDALIALNDNNTVRGLTLDGTPISGIIIAPTPSVLTSTFLPIAGIEVGDYDNEPDSENGSSKDGGDSIEEMLTHADINNNVFNNLLRGVDLEFASGGQNVFINIAQNAFNNIQNEGILIDALGISDSDSDDPLSPSITPPVPEIFNLNISGNTFNNVAANNPVTLTDSDVADPLANNPSLPVSQLFAVDMTVELFNGSNINVSNNKFQDIGGGIHLFMAENGGVDANTLGVYNTNVSNNTIDNFGNVESITFNLTGSPDFGVPSHVLGAQGIDLVFEENGTLEPSFGPVLFNNTIEHNVITDGFSHGIEVEMTSTSFDNTFNNIINNNDIERLSTLSTGASSTEFNFEFGPALSDGILVNMGETAGDTLSPDGSFHSLNVTNIIDNNHIVDILGHGINVESLLTPFDSPNSTTPDVVLKIDNNTIDQTAADGIRVNFDGFFEAFIVNFDTLTAPAMQFEIDNNTITNVGSTTGPVGFCDNCDSITPFVYSDGINFSINTFGAIPNQVTPNILPSSQAIVGEINNNKIDNVGFGDGIRFFSSQEDEFTLNLNVANNNVSHINGLSFIDLIELTTPTPATSEAESLIFVANALSGDGISVSTLGIVNTNNITIANNKVNDTQYLGIYNGVDFNTADSDTLTVNISGNNVDTSTLGGIAVTFGDLFNNTTLNINNNTVKNIEIPALLNEFTTGTTGFSLGDGIAVGLFNVGDIGTTNTVTINGNTTQNTDFAGIALGVFGQYAFSSPDINQTSLIISNNNISDSDMNGISVSLPSNGVTSQPLSIIDNTISTIQTGFGIIVNGSTSMDFNTGNSNFQDVNATITGNTVTPNQGPAADKAVCVGEDVGVNGNFNTSESSDDELNIEHSLGTTNTLHGEVTAEGNCTP